MRAVLVRLHVGHLPVGSPLDDVRVALEESDAQQPIMVRRLLRGRDPQPLAVRIEVLGHAIAAFVRLPGPTAYRADETGSGGPGSLQVLR